MTKFRWVTNHKVLNQTTICHPDRSVAKWRDLRFPQPASDADGSNYPTLCHPERTRISYYAAPKDDLVCGFHRGKPHELCGTHRTQQEIRGSRGICSFSHPQACHWIGGLASSSGLALLARAATREMARSKGLRATSPSTPAKTISPLERTVGR